MRRGHLGIATLLALLSGCAHGSATSRPTSSAPPAPSTTSTTSADSSKSARPPSPSPSRSSTTTLTSTSPSIPVIATPIQYECYPTEGTAKIVVDSLAEVWARKLRVCSVKVDKTHQPEGAEVSALASYAKARAEETASEALSTMYGICADPDDELRYFDMSKKDVLTGASLLCPKAPHAELMKDIAAGNAFYDGTYAVGSEVRPGTYKTDRVTDCYWERSTAGGATIANDFASNAPAGVTVTIRASDGGFKSEGCGRWRRVR